MSTKALYRPQIIPAKALRAPGKVGSFDGSDILRLDLRRFGFVPGMEGGERGTNTQGDVITQTIDGRDLNEVWAEFQAALAIYNQDRNRLIDLLTFQVTQPVEDVPIFSNETFERASEFGEPRGIRGGGYFSMGYDFNWYDLAVRFTWMFLAESTDAQVSALNNQALEADNANVFFLVMRAVFNNATRVANIRQQSFNVYPFYNADMPSPPPRFKNTTFATTHNHYMTSGAATVEPGDLDDLASNINEHGYGVAPTGQLLLLANKQEVNRIKQFRVNQSDVTLKGTNDFIPVASTPAILNANQVVVGAPASTYSGFNVIGQYGNWLVVEEAYVPAGYLLGLSTGGEQSANNPVGVREHAQPGLRGLRLVKGATPDYPLIDSFYNRGMGTGVRQRGAGAVMQITANASYAVPADYLAPL